MLFLLDGRYVQVRHVLRKGGLFYFNPSHLMRKAGYEALAVLWRKRHKRFSRACRAVPAHYISRMTGLPPNRSLTAEDGAKFLALIEELDDGRWQASAVVRLDSMSHVDEQSSGLETFPHESAAREWVDRAAATRGFKEAKLQVKRLR